MCTAKLLISCMLAIALLQHATSSQNVDATSAENRATQIFKKFWEWRLVNWPEFATFIGDHRYDGRLDDMSFHSYLRRRIDAARILRDVKYIHSQPLAASVKTNLELLTEQLVQFISGQKFKSYLWPMNRNEGPQADFPRLLGWMKKNTTKDVLKILARMRAFATQVDQQIILMKYGIQFGFTMHKVSCEILPPTFKDLATQAIEKSPVFAPFTTKPHAISDKAWQKLVTKAKGLMKSSIQPSYNRLFKFFKNEYLKHTRPNIAASSLPNGRAFYAACLKYHTTTNKTAQEIHNIGLSEVKRITGRMEKVKNQVKFKGSLKEFRKYLRTDLKFNYSSSEEIVTDFKAKTDANHKLLPTIFSVLPKVSFNIVPIQPAVAASYPAAYYLAGDGKRPGTFYINTYKPETRKKYDAVALSLHEAEPGHHLQSELTMEAGSPLAFRRFMDDRKYYEPPAQFPKYTAYVEGWGLYSEYLGEEMGVLTDSYDMFGRLSAEMLRACRLVVDTGMHALGWSREKAIKFMADNTADDIFGITVEIDRYITWPGQACGYKIGEIQIKAIRRKAEKALGGKFNVRKFHTLIAAMGGVSMTFLEKQVDQFIKQHL